MGIMGSAFGRALSGAGAGVAGIANKYIDEELAANKARLLADLQRTNAKAMAQDAIDVDTAPANVAKRTAANRAMTLDGAAAKREAELAGLNDADYQGALTKKGDADAEAATRRTIAGKKAELTEVTPLEIKALQDKLKATIPLEAQRAGAIAEATGKAQAKYREPRVDAGEEIAKKMNAIQKQLGRELTEPEKLGLLGLSKGRDPEMDTETVKETIMNPDGTMREVTRKQVRRPNAPGGQPTDDPIKAAMDAARLAKTKPTGAAATPAVAESLIAGRPYLQVPTNKLNDMLRGKVSSMERQDILMEIARRKEGDIR